MILSEVWKQKVFPILCQLQDFNPKSTFHLYMLDSCEAADDSLLDLVDYCHRKLTLLASEATKDYAVVNDRQMSSIELRGFLTDVLIDQLPNLVELQRFLAHLAVTDPAPPKKELILEQVQSHSPMSTHPHSCVLTLGSSLCIDPRNVEPDCQRQFWEVESNS
ncbi:hypothetical protein XENOCAPTIV_000027 [Xenoophorus captivus]|uniref:Uncharacterized protein n=1 Tax=Xenoophorus captivus TaxID=1517983 RepID=A0ABV0Q464_9TELE